MASVEPPPTSGANTAPRRRGNRRGGRAPAADTAAAPNSTLDAPLPAGSAPAATVSNSDANRGRNNRRGGFGRGRGRGGTQPMVNGRVFGGQLTAASPASSSTAGSLAGDAPEFVPGRP